MLGEMLLDPQGAVSTVLRAFRRVEVLLGGRGKGSWAGSPCCFSLRVGLFPSPGSGICFLAGVRSCACRRRSSFPSVFRFGFRAPRCAPLAGSRRADGPAVLGAAPWALGLTGERALGGSVEEGSQSVCKHHCFDTEAYGAVKNSKKKPHSRCCKGRKLARDSQACKMPASPALRGEPASGELAGAGSVHAGTVPRP